MENLTTKNEEFFVFNDKAEQVAPQVTELWHSAKTNMFTIGETLHDLKAEVEHGQWTEAFKQCAHLFPFTIRTAQKLLKIADFEPFASKDIRECVAHVYRQDGVNFGPSEKRPEQGG